MTNSKCFASLLVLVLLQACSTGQNIIRKPVPFENTTYKQPTKPAQIRAPWEVWTFKDFNNQNLKNGYSLILSGKIEEGLAEFEKAIANAKSSEEAETAVLMLCSTQLKMGQGKTALGSISKYASKRGIQPDQLDARFSLLAGYAYINLKEYNQAYAWFGQSFKASSGVGNVAAEARRASRQLARTHKDQEIGTLSDKWKSDNFISSLFLEEQQRRLRGGSPLVENVFSESFEPRTYSRAPEASQFFNQEKGSQEFPVTETSKSSDQVNIDELKYGVILPLSGTYSQHADKIVKGIELAFEQSNIHTPLIKVDSNTTPMQDAYQKLIMTDRVSAVFGPLLVKDAEDLIRLSSASKIPVITFAKKKGLPQLSESLFRLGATAENQLSEMYRYASQVKLISQILLFTPDDDLGLEFQDAAKSINDKLQTEAFKIQVYSPRNIDLISKSVEALALTPPQGIAVVDSPARLETLLRAIKDNSNFSNTQIFGSAITAEPNQISRYYSIMEGIILTTLFNPASREFVVTKFVEDYRNRFQEAPDLLAAQGYDSAMLTLKAFKNVEPGKLFGSEVTALENVGETVCVTGIIKPDKDGDFIRTLRLVQIREKSLVEIK